MLGTSDLSKFINMKKNFIYKTRKKETVSYNKTIGAFFFALVNITVLRLTNPDVNLKRMHQLYNVGES